MTHQTLELFTESAWGGLAPVKARLAQEPENAWQRPTPPALSFVETLGFPKGTPPRLLAEVLARIHAAPPGSRVDQLMRPGMLSRLFSQSAAEASYALAVLSVVESPDFQHTLDRLRDL
ncbi:hypothetical protein [Hydrogenophaga sp.]|uniref:hypothetical protein n=1 Tax=Hydrogenophaga sp. TaxID=1904254 RepID=UPI0035AE92BD